MCNSIGSGHWLAVHYDCVLWGSGSTLLFASPWEEQEPEATRANSRYETNTGFSHCGNLNLSLGGQDFFPCMKKPAIGRETSPSHSCVSLYLPPCCQDASCLEEPICAPEPGMAISCICFRFFMKTNKPRSSKVLSLIGHVKSQLFSWCPTCVLRYSWRCVFSSQTQTVTAGTNPIFFPPALTATLCSTPNTATVFPVGNRWNMRALTNDAD